MLQVGPHICVFKTHVDVFDKWSDDFAAQLRTLADKHGVWSWWCMKTNMLSSMIISSSVCMPLA